MTTTPSLPETLDRVRTVTVKLRAHSPNADSLPETLAKTRGDR